jgi:hypothetical protein
MRYHVVTPQWNVYEKHAVAICLWSDTAMPLNGQQSRSFVHSFLNSTVEMKRSASQIAPCSLYSALLVKGPWWKVIHFIRNGVPFGLHAAKHLDLTVSDLRGIMSFNRMNGSFFLDTWASQSQHHTTRVRVSIIPQGGDQWAFSYWSQHHTMRVRVSIIPQGGDQWAFSYWSQHHTTRVRVSIIPQGGDQWAFSYWSQLKIVWGKDTRIHTLFKFIIT